jgi:hypothetical protein
LTVNPDIFAACPIFIFIFTFLSQEALSYPRNNTFQPVHQLIAKKIYQERHHG